MFILKVTERQKNIVLILCIIILLFLSTYIVILKIFTNTNNDYKKLGIKIKDYDIEYYTVYNEDILSKYKVYKINNSSISNIKNQLENSELWSKNKYYEYIMKEFYELNEGKKFFIDRENLYYYKKAYAILDIKNAKLYYFVNPPLNYHNDYSKILGITTSNYKAREIYSVRGGPQNDGTDYYTYEFAEEQKKDILNILEKSPKWTQDRLDNDKLDDFEYNEEVLSIENGYYYYGLVCRTRDENKKYNFKEEEATGWEIGVYDVDKNILYYYWTSY